MSKQRIVLRGICITLALMVATCLYPGSALAKDFLSADVTHPAKLAPRRLPDAPANTLQTVESDDEAAVTVQADVPQFVDLDVALDYVREKAKERQTSVVVNITDEAYQLLDEAVQDLFSHTGDPAGGDYLASATYWWGMQTSNAANHTHQIEFQFEFWDNASIEAQATAKTQELVSSLGLKNDTTSDFEKIRAIYDYIVANVEYDYDTYYGSMDHTSAYCGSAALVDHLAVCQGYSSMFYRLALEAGIDARIITSDSLYHAWNIVRLGDKYYLLDCTWASTSDDTYFLRGSKDFFGHYNDDDQFSNEDFAAQYPLYEYACGKDGAPVYSMQWPQAPNYTLLTTDGRVVSTAATEGRTKALVFYSSDCIFAEEMLRTINGDDYPGVDILFCHMEAHLGSTLDQMSQIGTQKYPTDTGITYCYGANSYDALCALEDLLGMRDPEGYMSSPTLFFVDAQNRVVYATHGGSANDFVYVQRYLANQNAPAASEGEDYGAFLSVGNCGKNAIWHYYADGTLRIRGTGALWNNQCYYDSMYLGWMSSDAWDKLNAYSAQPVSDPGGRYTIDPASVRKVVVDKGISLLGAQMFSDCENLESITFCGSAPGVSDEGRYGWSAPLAQMGTQVVAYYPADDATWTKAAKRALAGNGDVRWVSVDADGVHHHVWGAWKTTKAATVSSTGKQTRTCDECGDTESRTLPKLKPTPVTPAISLSQKTFVYDGKTHKPGVTVKAGTKTLATSQYTVAWPADVKSVGTHAVSVTLKGNYTGSGVASYTIVPKGTMVSKLVVAKGAITVRWKKQATQTTGYEVQYGTAKSFKGAKSVTVAGVKSTSKKLKGLKSKKTYYVRVRTYKKVGGKTYYSAWSEAASAKTK